MRNLRKKSDLKIVFLFLCLTAMQVEHLNGQCIADAGELTAVCTDVWGVNPTPIGGMPSASNGVAPYQYVWETQFYTLTGTLRTASDFLNDTTLTNPTVINVGNQANELIFYLTVTDANGAVCTDSVTVVISRWVHFFVDKYAYINAGDTIMLGSFIQGGIPPLSYHWEPPYNLLNSNSLNPLAYPDTTTFYTLVVTDSNGCTALDLDTFEVYILTTGNKDLPENSVDIKLYPNPVGSEIAIESGTLRNELLTVLFYDPSGRLLDSHKVTKNKQVINISSLKKCPLVFYQVLNVEGAMVGSGKLLVRE